MNTKEETEIKKVMDSVSSAQKELAGCPSKKTLRDRTDVKDKDRRAENTESLVLQRATYVCHQRIIFINPEPGVRERKPGRITKLNLPFIPMALLMVAQRYLCFP